MALRYKVDVIQLLKDSGYSTYAIRKEKLIIENMLQKLRNNQMVSWATLDKQPDGFMGNVGYHLQADAFSARRYFRIRPRRGRIIKVDKLSTLRKYYAKRID